MKHRVIYAWLMISLFAVVSFGGCGGSSSSSLPPAEETSPSSVSMKEAIDSDDVMQRIYDQVVSNDFILIGLAEAKIYELAESGDNQIWAMDISFSSEEDTPSLYDAEALRRHYDSEDVIILAEADIDFINKIRTALGELPEDPGIVGSSGYLEVYAMARISKGNAFRTFTYTVPVAEDIISSEGEISQDVSLDSITGLLSTDSVIANDNEAMYTAIDFVVERWVNLFAWVAAFGIRNALREEVAASATGDLTDAADCQSRTFDFSYNGLTASGITYTGWDNSVMAFKRSRMNSLGLEIYAAHSFQTGNDYYYVQSTASTTTKNYKSVNVSPTGSGTIPYVYGYTKYLGFEAWLDGAAADTVTLAASNPNSLKGSPASGGAKYSATTTRSLTSWTGVNQYTAPYAVDGANYSHALNWAPYGYDIVNNSGATHPSSAAWYAEAYLPAVMWGSLVTSGNSTGTLSYNADWVWEVKPSFWRSHTSPKLNVEFVVRDGATIGEFTQGGTKHDRADKWFGSKQAGALVLTPPPHTTAHLIGHSLSSSANSMPVLLYNLGAKYANKETYPFAYTLDGIAETVTLKVLAEDAWTLTYKTSDGGNWVSLSGTSGTATGADAKDVTLTFERNTGSSRVVQVNIQSGQDTATVNILQQRD